MNKNHTAQIEWLKVLLAFGGVAILILIYILLPSHSSQPLPIVELLRNAIPSAVVVLVAFIALYFLFYKAGITTRNNTVLNIHELAGELAEYLKEGRAFDAGLLEFHQTFRNVDWKRQLLEAREHVDIVVYYFDSWVNTNFNEIVAYFQRPKTKMRIFVADPEAPTVLDEIHRLFPEYSKETLKEKIMRTGERIREAARNAGAADDRVEFYLVSHPLSYSAQLIDRTRLILSIFEMNRLLKIDSPAFIIDVSRNRHLDDFIKKEIDGLLKSARKVPGTHSS